MPTCHACQTEIEAPSLATGRCAQCGALLPAASLRETLDTLELNPDATQTLELDEAVSETEGTATVEFAGGQTVDFTNDSIDIDTTDSMVTAQWLDNVAGGESDPEVTIKQKETVSAGSQSRSSLVVKSRHFCDPGNADISVTSEADSPDYELLEKIGEGGMGVVYTAKQSSIARTVAVKMLKGDKEHTQEQREKFISEAVVTGELDHPNIVPIYDLGSNDAGALFYSMKRVRGTPWDDAIQEKSLDENLNILLRVADAIAFAHANGVLHRDLKPENVMLGDFGEVLVMDWGLARISDEFPSIEAVSQSDVMGGTPAYMAPEMATGPIDEVTTASDIYLLGAILYEIITGRPPHSGKTVMACLFAAAKNEFATTKNAEHLHTGELFDIAMRTMATQPAKRYATVQGFQDAVRLYLSHSESVLLTESAAKNLEAAIAAEDYDLYSRSVYGFEEALSLWSGNPSAQELLSASRGAYAQSALDRTDFELGISLLDAESPEHEELLAKLIAGRNESESRQRRLTWMKRAVAALLLTVAGIVSVSYFAVRTERNKAITERDRADENFREAEAARKVADEQRGIAVTEKNRAETEQARAESEKERAETEQARAEREEAKAKKQEQLAIQAKQAEAYEAYVARIGLANAKIEENAFDRASELLEQCDPELRHWEWGRLSYLCQLSRQTWRVDGPVEAVAMSPDGRTFASGDWEGQAKLWDAETGEELHSLSHGQYVHAVAFDPTGRRLATGSSDQMVHIYEVESGKLLQTLAGHTDAVQSVQFSSDGDRLLTAGFDNTARIWDLATGELQQTLTGHSWWVWAAEFSPDDQRVVTVSQDGKAIVWQRHENKEYQPLTEFAKHSGPIYAAQFSPDGTMIATAGYDRRVLLWNPDQVQPVDIARRLDNKTDPPAPYEELAQHDGPVRTLAFSPDGRQLVSGGQDNVLRVWDLTTGQERAVLRGHASHVRDCVFSADGQLLLSAGRDQNIKLWQPDSYGESLTLGAGAETKQADAVLAARFSRDGTLIVTANRDRTATLWDAGHQTPRQTPLQTFAEGHDFLASSAVFSADGTKLATGAGDGTARIWDVATGTEILQLNNTGRTASLAISPNGQWIATGSPHNVAIVWNAQTGEQVAELTGHEAAITSVAFSHDSQTLATGDDLGRCRLWNHEASPDKWTGSHWLRGHSRAISAMAFVDQGNRLLTASGDNTCGQWDVATGQEQTDLVLRHPDRVTDMATSQDGTRVLTSCDDGKLRLWSLADARVLREIEPASDVLFTSVDLSADGSQALTATAANGKVQIWNLATGDELPGDDGAAWMEFGDRGGILWAARFASQGDQVLTIGGNDARLWDVASHEPVVRFSPHGAVASADISPDGKLLVTGSWDRSAKIWNIASGKAVRKLDGLHQGYVNSVEFSPDGQTILTASDDGTARMWDVATGKPTGNTFALFSGRAPRIRQATFSSDGARVLTTANDKMARIFDRHTGEILQSFVGHEWAVLCGEFSRDGERIITGSEDNTARIWDTSSGKQLLTLAGHTDSITSVAFSPDGRRAMTASQDNTAKLWDAETGKEILTLTGHHQELSSVSFSPNGEAVLTSGRDGATILWPTINWRAPAQQQANRQQ